MTKKKSASLGELTTKLRSIGRAFVMHSRLIFSILVVLALIFALINLNMTLNQPSDEDYRSQQQKSSPTNFDKETIDQINRLNTQESINLDAIPAGRYNPFNE